MAGERNTPPIDTSWAEAISPQGATIRMPVFLGLNQSGTNTWMLPYGAKVELRGVNEVVRRYVAKRRDAGTVKELWMRGDWEITLTGMLIGVEEDGRGRWPEDEVRLLRSLFEARQVVYVICQKTSAVGIDRMVITALDLPATAGDANQEFRIVGFSDQLYEPL